MNKLKLNGFDILLILEFARRGESVVFEKNRVVRKKND